MSEPRPVAVPAAILPFQDSAPQVDRESDATLSLQEREILARIHVRCVTSSRVCNAVRRHLVACSRYHLLRTQDLQRRLVKHTEDETKRPLPVNLRTRLIVVSNRLPVSLKRDEESGEWTFTVSSGGGWLLA